jgi:hypothetical protein
LLVTASVVHSSPILVTLMNEALSSSETSVLSRATGGNILKDAIIFVENYPDAVQTNMALTYLDKWFTSAGARDSGH